MQLRTNPANAILLSYRRVCDIMNIKAMLTQLCTDEGVYEVGFSMPPDAPDGLPYAVTIVCALSDAVIDEIGDAPTFSYFHHYRTVNAFIDATLLRAGMLLQREGYKYIPIPASQSIKTDGERTHFGRYSHKKAAALAGLGTVGRSSLFLHNRLGARVRLGTLFTDCPVADENSSPAFSCGSCRACVSACPSGAITGEDWAPGQARDIIVDAARCSSFMRDNFTGIGRGAVCGICMKVCPRYRMGAI